VYFDIVQNRRIVYCYDMYVNDEKVSVSLATIEFEPAGKGTKLVLTEQGTKGLIENLAKYLEG